MLLDDGSPESQRDWAEVLARNVDWSGYATARLITDKDLQLIQRYDKRTEQLQTLMLDEVGLMRDAGARPGHGGPIAGWARGPRGRP